MVNNKEEIYRILTIKGNIVDTIKEIEKQMESASLKDLKELKKKKKRFESKLNRVEKEINMLKNPRERTDKKGFIQKKKDIVLVEEMMEGSALGLLNDPSGMDNGTLGDAQDKNEIIETVPSVKSDKMGMASRKIKRQKIKSPKVQKQSQSILDNNKTKPNDQKRFPLVITGRFYSWWSKDKKKSDKKSYSRDLTYLLAAVFLLSLSLLMFEIALTRIFSVMFSYHYSFLAISLALFGLGMGGVLIHTLSSKFDMKGYSILTMGSMISFPYTDNMMFYYGLMFVPFLIAGTIFALIFTQFAGQSRVIYSIDLIGAGVGCFIVVLFLDRIGGINTVIGIGLLSALGALFFALPTKSKRAIGAAIAVIFLISVLFLQNISSNYFDDVPIGSDPNKDMFRLMSNYDLEVVETRWSAFGRTDLLIDKNESNQNEMLMFIDGSSGTAMYRFNGDINDTNNTVVRQIPLSFGGYFPFLFPEKDDVLIIGPGGGRDVLIAMMGGAGNITAVEINQDIVDIMRDYSWFNGGLYTDFSNIEVVVDEGRSFLKRSKEKYDIIMLSIPITKTSGSVSGYSLSENYLFTKESFKDYFDHLSNEGRLVIVPHDMNEVYKLTSITISMFQEMGKSENEAMKHIVVAGPGGHHGIGGIMFPSYIIKKTPFSYSESKEIHDLAMMIGYQHVFVPYNSPIMVDDHFYHWENSIMEFETCMAPLQVDMRPPTDDSPFFYKFEKGIPPVLSSLIGYSLLISLIVLIVPAIYRAAIYKEYVSKIKNKSKRVRRREKYLLNRSKSKKNSMKFEKLNRVSLSKFVLYFSILGFVFMVIEISLFQKFILFLGHPTLSISVLLFSLLISSGLGSLYSNSFKMNTLLKKVSVISLIITCIIIVYIVILPFIFDVFLSADVIVRILITGILLFPLGFFMGIPFSSGISLMGRNYKKDIPWMWGINGTFSVLGSAFAIMIAMTSGFTGGLITGAFGYFIIFIMFR
jgi:hypothetical protein